MVFLHRHTDNEPVMFKHMPSSRKTNEQDFALPLSVFLSGTDDRGRLFQEETRLSSINAFEVRCDLKDRVPVGSAIRLSLDIPETPFLGPPLKLFLAGEVAAIQRRKDPNTGWTVCIKLFSRFRLQPKVLDEWSDSPIFSAKA